MLYPQFTVIVPKPGIHVDLLAYPIVTNDPSFLIFINYWLEMQKESGFTQELYQYWILGKKRIVPPPRFCLFDELSGPK